MLVRTVAEKKLLPAVLHVQLHDSQTDVLRHLMNKLHLDHASDFFSLAPQNQLGNLLITHVSRSVNLRAQFLDLGDVLGLSNLYSTVLDQREICADILEHSEARASWRPVPGDFHGLVFQCDHRLGEHDCRLLPTKSVKRFVTVWLLLSLRLERVHPRLRQFAHLIFLSLKTYDNWIECLDEILDRVIDSRVRERRRDHREQVIDDHLGQIKNLGVLLVRIEQVPVKLCSQIR